MYIHIQYLINRSFYINLIEQLISCTVSARKLTGIRVCQLRARHSHERTNYHHSLQHRPMTQNCSTKLEDISSRLLSKHLDEAIWTLARTV